VANVFLVTQGLIANVIGFKISMFT